MVEPQHLQFVGKTTPGAVRCVLSPPVIDRGGAYQLRTGESGRVALWKRDLPMGGRTGMDGESGFIEKRLRGTEQGITLPGGDVQLPCRNQHGTITGWRQMRQFHKPDPGIGQG